MRVPNLRLEAEIVVLPVIPVVILRPFWEGSTFMNKVMRVKQRENVNNS